jgi:hypothetical protein
MQWVSNLSDLRLEHGKTALWKPATEDYMHYKLGLTISETATSRLGLIEK